MIATKETRELSSKSERLVRAGMMRFFGGKQNALPSCSAPSAYHSEAPAIHCRYATGGYASVPGMKAAPLPSVP
eukprot:1141525-Pelagomonas_calceolata.AAC.2